MIEAGCLEEIGGEAALTSKRIRRDFEELGS